ncbi:TH1 [Scenedesmus sp. PABB004]|nr:TH1 [Scenedesmus sp. PABB004]
MAGGDGGAAPAANGAAAAPYDLFSGLPVPGGLSERLWRETAAEAAEALQHPFVLALAAGTLDRACFQHYVLQDTFFLAHYAMAYAAALDKCSGAPRYARARAVLAELLLGIDMELRLHGAYAAKWGVDAGARITPSAATAAYTDFLMAVAHDPEASVAEVLAAMVPCSRLYGFLGCSLAAATAGRPRHAYSEWVGTYSSAVYLASPVMKEELFDSIADTAPYERLKALYTRAMQLEVNFFSAQPNSPHPRHIGLLVSDFDETLTAKDTIGALLGAAVEAQARAAAGGADERERLRGDLAARVKQLADDYASQQQALLARLLPAPAPVAGRDAAAAPAAPYDGAGLAAVCEALSDFDVAMNQVVIDAGVLKGLTRADAAAAAAPIELRPGAAHVLAAAAAAGLRTAVLSVNWSTTLVQEVLRAGGAAPGGAAAPAAGGAPGQQAPDLRANELAWDADGVSSGSIECRVQCARDKGAAMRELLAEHRGGGAGAGAVVYVGDSASDIPALLEADYGIVIGANALLRRVLAAFGVPLRPLAAAPLEPPAAGGERRGAPSLYEAASWEEVGAFVFGPTHYVTSGPVEGAASRSGGGAASSPGGAARGFASMVHVPTAAGAGALAAEAVNAAAAASGAGACGGVGGLPPLVLTIAGSDSGGGAGIQADLKTIMANGGFGMSALTAVTAQNSRGVQAVHALPLPLLEAQLDSVLSDLRPAAVKTGMLPDAAAVAAVARKLREHGAAPRRGAGDGASWRALPLVVDPVMISTSGHALAGGGVAGALVEHLFPLAAVVTPNLAEAAQLLGAERPLTSVADMRAAAAALHKLGAAAVLVKGGHLLPQGGAPGAGGAAGDEAGLEAVDVLFDGRRYYCFSAPYVPTSNTHGTGCTLAAAIATGLARGLGPVDAVAGAKAYLTHALAGSAGLALGAGPQRPFHHGAGFARRAEPAPRAAALAGPRRPNGADLRAYVVTDPACNARAGRTLLDAVAAAVAGGATVVQLREKEIDGGDFVEAARAAIKLCRPAGVPVVINDRVDVALAAGADGVHVGQSDIPARLVRSMLGPGALLGVSVKTPAEAAKAAADGADYVGVGAVFPTGTKASEVVGLAGLEEVCRLSSLPAVAIGGVNAANAAEVIAAGAKGLAVVSAVFAAPDVEAATRELRAAVDAALETQAEAGAPEREAAAAVA